MEAVPFVVDGGTSQVCVREGILVLFLRCDASSWEGCWDNEWLEKDDASDVWSSSLMGYAVGPEIEVLSGGMPVDRRAEVFLSLLAKMTSSYFSR
jgi:hypothetical protein